MTGEPDPAWPGDTPGPSELAYEFVVDSAYIQDLIAHQYRQRLSVFRPMSLFAFLGIISGAVYLMSTQNPVSDASIAYALFIVLVTVLTGVGLLNWALLQRFRGHPDFGSRVRVVLSRSGVQASGLRGRVVCEWSHYERAVRFKDGILLWRQGAIRWLPDSAIKDSSAGAATHLVSTKIPLVTR